MITHNFPTVVFYACTALAFIFFNICLKENSTADSYPKLVFKKMHDPPNWKIEIDKTKLRSSINRLSSVKLTRMLGNSIRLSLGQRIPWISWYGSKNNPMLYTNRELWVSEKPNDNTLEKIALSASRISDLALKANAAGWKVLIAPVPTKLGIHRELAKWPNFASDPLTKIPITNDHSDYVYSYFLDRLKSNGIETVDLQTAFRRFVIENPDELLYPPGESHWSGRGMRVAADATSDEICRILNLKRNYPNSRLTQHAHIGDLVKAYDINPLLKFSLKPIYTFTEHLEDGEVGKGYRYPNQPSSLVVVSGTSYTGQYTWLIGKPVGFSWLIGSRLDNAQVQNRPFAGKGSFYTFSNFLENQEKYISEFATKYNLSAQHIPKLVVWEFPIRDLFDVIK